MKDPKVSIIIPTYKRSRYIKKTVLSALHQSYANIEIIVVDDNNPDDEEGINTSRIMSTFCDQSIIKYIQHPYNKNGAAARNTGIKYSTGNFISFLDDDDEYLFTKVEKQIKYLANNTRYRGVYCGVIRNNKREIWRQKGNLAKELLLMEVKMYTPTLMFYKDTLVELNGFDEKYKRHQDYEILLRYFEKYEIGVIEESLVKIGYNDGENNIKGEKLNQLKEMFFVQFEDVIKRNTEKDKKFINKVRSKHYSSIFINHLGNSQIKCAYQIMKQQIVEAPIYFIIYTIMRIITSVRYKINRHSN